MKNNMAMLSLLVLFSCAKARELPEESLGGLETVVQPTKAGSGSTAPTDNKSMLDVRRYEGKILTIESATSATVKLSHKNARDLYESLQLKKFGNKDQKTKQIVNYTKRGFFVYCQEDVIQEKAVEESLSCSFKINPHSGFLESQNWDNFSPLLDPTVVPVKADGFHYKVNAIMLTVMVRGKDARALYESLNLPAIEKEEGEAKISTKGGAPLLTCVERLTDTTETYVCSIHLNLKDGSIPTNEEMNEATAYELVETKPAEAKPAVEAEKKAEITSPLPETEAEVVQPIEIQPNP